MNPILPIQTREPVRGVDARGRPWEIPPEVIPDIDSIEIEDGAPVESIFVEKQYRLLTETLYASWTGPGEDRSFMVCANVGLFYQAGHPPLVPDVMLSLGVDVGDLSQKEYRSYFLWVRGKPPDVVIEIVSDTRGGEDSHKMSEYARIGIAYYAIYDPLGLVSEEEFRAFELRGKT